ncbi:hypothetical protein AB205_0025930 [Aquarana catesbeiana]|uniref:Uncharacterized protein n=1 Tax=Aquarana catesbeiana TaxID=8400 RepID=A0A2G9QA13_AQUCT|nr:hypothetical protein AB205_0025930 [Aquarana catesbeiana]
MIHIPISAIKYLCAKYTYFFYHRGSKTRKTTLIRGDHRPHTSGRRGNPPKQSRRRKTLWKLAPQQVIVILWIQINSESAQILIGEIMGCNRDLENIQKNINDVQQKTKNITDVLGRV